MARKKRLTPKTARSLPIVAPDAAGIDVGAKEMYVAVPQDRAQTSVRCFAAFTEDLQALAQWLTECHIKTVAMESTGVYWIPLFQILEARGFEVVLVNAHHVKNVTARKSDVSDCQWLQYLHAHGLLTASFRPEQQICALRAILRHRNAQIRLASRHIQHVQKALNQMNIHLHHVIADITGVTGQAILDAILAGDRDPDKLILLCNPRIKADPETIKKALVGDWREEHLFTMRQSLQSWRHYRQQIADCDTQIELWLSQLDPPEGTDRTDPPRKRYVRAKPARTKRDTNADRLLCHRLQQALGTDLTEVPGIKADTAQTILCEAGPNLSRFATAHRFASWLCLSPNNKKSGGRTISTHTQPTTNRIATALRMAASGLERSQTPLGDQYRRLKARLGAPKAITAMAHKLARIIYVMITKRCAYDQTLFAKAEQRNAAKRLQALKRQAAKLGYRIEPTTCAA